MLRRALSAVRLPRDPVTRLAALFDEGTLELLTALSPDGSGAVAATGLIDGSGAVAFASDPRVQGGAMGVEGCTVIVAAYDEAITRGVPVIGLWHSGGARLAEGVACAARRRNGVRGDDRGVRGGAADLRGARPGGRRRGLRARPDRRRDPFQPGRIFVTGPDVVRSVTGEDVDMARLGGPEPHSRRSGVVHLVAADDARGAVVRPHARLAAMRAGQVSAGVGRRAGPVRIAARLGPPRLRRAPADQPAARRSRGSSCTPSGRRTLSRSWAGLAAGRSA